MRDMMLFEEAFWAMMEMPHTTDVDSEQWPEELEDWVMSWFQVGIAVEEERYFAMIGGRIISRRVLPGKRQLIIKATGNLCP